MTQKHETLSALVDGELQDSNMIDSIGSDQELSEKWKRYHLIRHGLRKELPLHADFDISAQVLQALADEPVILAPKRSWQSLPLVASIIPFAKQGGQLAIAASVAVAMVIGVQQFNQPEFEQPFNNTPAVLPGIQGGLSPVSLEQTRPIQRADVLEQRRIINAYLTDHKQQLRLKTSDKETAVDQAESEQEQSGQQSDETPH